MLLPVGSSVKELYKEENSIYFVTQWEDKHGIRVNCGSDIFSKPLMGHAFGGMDDKTYHNTMAALEHGIGTGYKDFEIDFPIPLMVGWYLVMVGRRVTASVSELHINRILIT